MNFLENIFDRLSRASNRPILQEVRDGRIVPTSSAELMASVRAARAFLRKKGIKRGDRCGLLANNSARWVAIDLAIMAEGMIVVPLYARQAPRELAAMMRDCSPALLCCGDEALRRGIAPHWSDAPPMYLFEEVLTRDEGYGSVSQTPEPLSNEQAVTVIYTSGTSGEPKGVILNVGNLNHMLACTTARLDLLMGQQQDPEQVFHYLPFCFAGSWILLLSCLSRNSVLTLSTDLTKLADELRLAAPQYLLNVPALLERIRTGVEDQINKKGGLARTLYQKGKAAWLRRQAGHSSGLLDLLGVGVAQSAVFKAIRKKLGPRLRALICGSAPLAAETQLFFRMIGVPVLQVYGLTETTAICTMDHPHQIVPGRVGPAIDGIEMKLGEEDEILVRGPNIFPGYWNRPQETAKVFRDGWFRSGDQGDVDEAGNWRIIGRIKNLIILSSGHNVAPEPIEEMLLRLLPRAQQVLLAGNGRSHLAAIVTGDVTQKQVEEALERVNPQLPHYKRIHAFHLHSEPFSVENGLLTANGKLKRDAIAAHLQKEIEALYSSVSNLISAHSAPLRFKGETQA